MIRVGTCSWADESFVKAWYPDGVASGDRLRHYAERFEVVEANSTYYRLPEARLVERWASVLPDGFVMHVKAFRADDAPSRQGPGAAARPARRGRRRRSRSSRAALA